MTIYEFLAWLTSAGGAAALLSFVLERIDAWHTLPSNTRSWLTLAGTVAVALLSYAILTYVPEYILDTLAPWFQITAACVTAWLASQAAHTIDPARLKNAADK